MKGTEYCVSL